MLIGTRFEQDTELTTVEMCANHLADTVRNMWLDNTGFGKTEWEETFTESADAVAMLRQEGFPGLMGIDYLFQWWGAKDSEELAGELLVIWKLEGKEVPEYYRTWIRLAERDFVLGLYTNETRKRDENRKEFRKAFQIWKEGYPAGK